jgi:hypothetical protein
MTRRDKTRQGIIMFNLIAIPETVIHDEPMENIRVDFAQLRKEEAKWEAEKEFTIEPGPITKENYRQTQRTLKEAAQRILDATGLDKPRCDPTRQVKYVLPRPDSLEFLVG